MSAFAPHPAGWGAVNTLTHHRSSQPPRCALSAAPPAAPKAPAAPPAARGLLPFPSLPAAIFFTAVPQEPAQGGGGGTAERQAGHDAAAAAALSHSAVPRQGRALRSASSPARRGRHLRGRTPRPSWLLRLLPIAARCRPGVHRAPASPSHAQRRRARCACARRDAKRDGGGGARRSAKALRRLPIGGRIGRRAGTGQSQSTAFLRAVAALRPVAARGRGVDGLSSREMRKFSGVARGS